MAVNSFVLIFPEMKLNKLLLVLQCWCQIWRQKSEYWSYIQQMEVNDTLTCYLQYDSCGRSFYQHALLLMPPILTDLFISSFLREPRRLKWSQNEVNLRDKSEQQPDLSGLIFLRAPSRWFAFKNGRKWLWWAKYKHSRLPDNVFT